jgi:hypothetical protein
VECGGRKRNIAGNGECNSAKTRAEGEHFCVSLGGGVSGMARRIHRRRFQDQQAFHSQNMVLHVVMAACAVAGSSPVLPEVSGAGGGGGGGGGGSATRAASAAGAAVAHGCTRRGGLRATRVKRTRLQPICTDFGLIF